MRDSHGVEIRVVVVCMKSTLCWSFSCFAVGALYCVAFSKPHQHDFVRGVGSSGVHRKKIARGGRLQKRYELTPEAEVTFTLLL